MNNREKVYKFKVSLMHPKSLLDVELRPKNIYRVHEIRGKTSLHDFAYVILQSFGFDFDHPFGFYSNMDDTDESDEKFTVFYDDGEPESDSIFGNPNPLGFERGVENSFIYQVFCENKRMLFLFDYGYEWEFVVECHGFVQQEPGAWCPRVTEVVGEAPPQYE